MKCNKEKVAAVVVTYNRLELVMKTISALRQQKLPLDCIIVIDNHCTDGTTEWLNSQNDLVVIHQDNIGGSGGFWRGIKEAYDRKFDWIWCMDDDVFPSENCLEILLEKSNKYKKTGILCPHRIMNGKTFVAESKVVNFSNPLKNTFDYPLTVEDVESNDIVYIQGMSFEGPLIKREVVEKIGLPNKDLFILYDDTDYSYRAFLAGYDVAVVRDAIMDKHYFQSVLSYSEDKKKNKWKLAYHVRNSAYICHKYGKNFFVKYCGALPFVIKMYGAITFNFFVGHKYNLYDYWLLASMVVKGIKGKLGKIN